jgi:hypothetical protein
VRRVAGGFVTQWFALRIIGMVGVIGVGTVAALSIPARAAPCPGDLNGDNAVTINEIITAVNAALSGCAAPTQAGNTCPGDLNGDNRVTVDEIIMAVNAALLGCDSSPTPTPTLGHCPYTLLDDTLGIGASCGYSGAFSSSPTCSTELSALVLSDPTNHLVAVSVGSDPIITFGGMITSATTAKIVAYFVGDDLTPQPLAGTMELSDDGNSLIIDPDTVPAFNIGGVECTFDRYAGRFTRVVTDSARRTSGRTALRLRRLHTPSAAQPRGTRP